MTESFAMPETTTGGLPLARLLHPRGVAVVGASPDTRKLAGRPLAYLLRYAYEGAVHAVNPKYEEIDGRPCYPSIGRVPDPVDLALILLPAERVPEAVLACGARGIPFAITIASGFAEAGNAPLQNELRDACRRSGVRVIGPNCVGLLAVQERVTATFSTEVGRAMPRPGGLALVTQSGAVGNSLLQSCNALGIGVRAWISTGNEVDLGVLDLVDHLIDDPETTHFALFLEGLNDGPRLRAVAQRASQARKPILALRAGTSDLGRRVSVSHTSKLAGAAKVWAGVSRQAGIIDAGTVDDLVDLCLALDVIGAGRACTEPAGQDGVGLLTVSGGLGVLLCDQCAAVGIPLPPFTPATAERLRAMLPPAARVGNPVDTALFADEDQYLECAGAVLDDERISSLFLILTSLAHDYRALAPGLEALGRRAAAAGKHVALSFLSSSDPLPPELAVRLGRAGVLVLPSSERMVRVEAALRKLRRPIEGLAAGGPDRAALPAGEDILVQAQIPRPAERICASVQEAQAAAEEIGFPVVLKAISADLPHKTECGAVRLDLPNAAAVAEAWTGIVGRLPGSVLLDGMAVQAMVTGGVEMILACRHDPEFGPVVMLGAGGIWAEFIEDVAFRALPLGDTDVEDMLGELRILTLLTCARGRPLMDIGALEAAVRALGEAFLARPDLAEVEINPLAVLPRGEGVCALDSLVQSRPANAGSTGEHPR